MSNIAVKMSYMGFNHTEQFSYFCNRHFFYPFYNKLNQVAEESSIVPWISPAIGITVGMAKLIFIIGSVVEAAIKGISNLAVGVTTFNIDLLKMGSQQLLSTPFMVASIPIVLFITFVTTKNMILDPKKTSKKEAETYQESLEKFSNKKHEEELTVSEGEGNLLGFMQPIFEANGVESTSITI